MGDWIKVGSHDWRGEHHELPYYGVDVYVNLATGERRYVYSEIVYIDGDKWGKFERLEPPKPKPPIKESKK